jgi:hypothetical protein
MEGDVKIEDIDRVTLADVEIDELIRGLGKAHSEWIDVARQEKRSHTPAELTTLCVLGALEGALRWAASDARNRRYAEHYGKKE